MGVVAGGLVVASVALAGIALATRATPNEPSPDGASPAAVADSAAPIDIRWRSGRLDSNDCVGTFEVTRGTGSRARLVAFVMDTTGAIIARDSVQLTSAVSGLFVDFRFRKVGCDRIHDWQLQATTPMSKPE